MAKEAVKVSTSALFSIGTAPPPTRQKDLPNYNVPFGDLKKGQYIDLPFELIPETHTRAVAQRWGREAKVEIVTRTIKNSAGDSTALRVWHNGPKA